MRQVQEHFRLSRAPFGVTPDPAFLYLGATHREAMASLLHGIRSQVGFTALIASPGMGKTTLLFNLLQNLNGTVRSAFLFQTLCRPAGFLHALITDLGIVDSGTSFSRMHEKLNSYLLQESSKGFPVVLVIDEAQNLSEQVLEIVRMLSNFETSNRKLLHVVLAGQPQFAQKLSQDSLTQLRQRISIVARLTPLGVQDTWNYIDHRLHVAGYSGHYPLFTNQAYALIAEHSQGIPRNINTLCFNSMALGCALKSEFVDESMVREAIADLDLTAISIPAPRRIDVPAVFVENRQTASGALKASSGYRRRLRDVAMFLGKRFAGQGRFDHPSILGPFELAQQRDTP